MITVGDFKEAGLSVIRGDKLRMYPDEIGDSLDVTDVNNLSIFDNCEAESFAWRTNTGVKPEFVGEVELKANNGFTKVINTEDGFTGWRLTRESSSNGAKFCWLSWRPHLPLIQTETPEEKEAFEAMNKSPYDVGAHVSDASKPVYTQAMCDAGELPTVGSEFGCGGDFFIYLGLQNGFHYGSACQGGSYELGAPDWWDAGGFNPEPIKTELENAIDEMVSTAVNSADDIAKSIIYDACVKLAKAGYAKEKK